MLETGFIILQILDFVMIDEPHEWRWILRIELIWGFDQLYELDRVISGFRNSVENDLLGY